MLGTICRFWRDQRGIALILVTIMLPAIIGFALLAIDMSRANNLHNDVQKGADAFAIAAAAELDGAPDAWTRAERAMENLVDNTTRFSNSGLVTLASAGSVTVNPGASSCRSRGNISWCFLKSLPASDSSPITSSNYATTQAETLFVQVTVTPESFSSIFPASFLGGSNGLTVGATAVAGSPGAVVCDMVPVFICNPFPGQSLYEVANSGQFYKKSLKLVVGSTSWGPGNFGFLRPSDGHGYGETDLATDIAIGRVPECVSARRIYTQTGNLTTKVKAAFNTRFDIYANGGGFPSKSDPRWPPAPNVRKGFQYASNGNGQGSGSQNPCNMELATDATRYHQLTRDTSFTGQIGNGGWDYTGYAAANQMTSALTHFGSSYNNTTNPPSRYDLYHWENTHDSNGNVVPVGDPNSLVHTQSVGGETGVPACASTVGDEDRRLIYAAVVDCSDSYVQSQLNGQSGAPPAIGFASLFLTEAVTGDEVMAEIVDIAGSRGRGTMENFVRDDVQLYR
ncbi:pilus assembly protein TadG-related protein [Mesorhizobium sp. WSM4904]|uniref:pilus assembly protein TadG-related protein n=1 Tax=Mesorhizobium sp. WSM4904 TaxID=3038545 RepID=UPI0024181B86|nr:pilus assembly protein TadG-related protein [Mesorhizobium sp. WSM4904]WFP62787.1 pilus assembly protein TadG-related protein [Mesorhizobium sp. WSM4904]